MIRTQIYFSPSQMNSLKKKALKKRLSVSALIRRIVDEETFEEKQGVVGKNAGKWLASLAKEARKMKVRGPSDLAGNIDKYLYGDKK